MDLIPKNEFDVVRGFCMYEPATTLHSDILEAYTEDSLHSMFS